MSSISQTVRNVARIIRYRCYPVPFLARRYIHWVCASTRGALPKDAVCLDVGAGVSPYRGDIISGLGVSLYISFDIAPSDASTLIGDACKLPLLSESISVLVSIDTQQHIPNVSQAFDEIRLVLVPGGFVIISFLFAFGECDMMDFRRWSLAGMEDELLERGFEIIDVRRRGGAFFAAASALHWAVQHIIPGARRSWRVRISPIALLRGFTVTLLTLPTAAIAWLALFIDGLLPRSGLCMGGWCSPVDAGPLWL